MLEEADRTKAPKPQPPGNILDLKFLPKYTERPGDRIGKYPLL